MRIIGYNFSRPLLLNPSAFRCFFIQPAISASLRKIAESGYKGGVPVFKWHTEKIERRMRERKKRRKGGWKKGKKEGRKGGEKEGREDHFGQDFY